MKTKGLLAPVVIMVEINFERWIGDLVFKVEGICPAIFTDLVGVLTRINSCAIEKIWGQCLFISCSEGDVLPLVRSVGSKTKFIVTGVGRECELAGLIQFVRILGRTIVEKNRTVRNVFIS